MSPEPQKPRKSDGEFSPVGVYKPRLKRLRSAMTRAEVPALLVTNSNDVRYLTPFCGDDSYAIVTGSSLWVLSDARFEVELGALKGYAQVFMRQGDMLEALKQVAGDLALKTLGIQAEHVTLESRARMGKALRGTKLVETNGLVAALRAVKDEDEIAFIRRAVSIQEAALKATLAMIKPGVRELDVAARLEFEMKARGSVKPAFESIVAFGANGAKAHAVPGVSKLAKNGTVLIDWGARSGGYCSDMTRTFTLGKWHPLMADVYKLVLDAHQAALQAARPGMTGQELDAVARGVIEKSGYGPRFGHGLGHGIGLNIHENPRVNRFASEGTLQPGMVVTIEPGIYLPGVGGVRIEDDVLITKRGGEGLCTLPKSLQWATL
ncbi:MAG: M24 family metallopeptidase [Phycisphaerales bacterium]